MSVSNGFTLIQSNGDIDAMTRFMAASKVLGEETVNGNGAAGDQGSAGK